MLADRFAFRKPVIEYWLAPVAFTRDRDCGIIGKSRGEYGRVTVGCGLVGDGAVVVMISVWEMGNERPDILLRELRILACGAGL
jgi:hypothetical protein